MTAPSRSRFTTTAFVLQLVAATLYCFGAVAMKRSDGLTRLWPSLLLLAFFCAGAALHALAMKHTEMGVTYIVVLGLEVVLSFGLSMAIFGEAITASKVAAIVLIVAGIVLIQR